MSKSVAGVLLGVLLLIPPADAADIIWVSFHTDDDAPSAAAAAAGFTQAPDAGYTQLLRANGHNITRYVSTGTPDTNLLNAADLVIVSRSVLSNTYENDAETGAWHGITAPMIVMAGYTLGSNRLGFITGTNIPDVAGTVRLKVNNPSHPIFAGISLDVSNTMIQAYANIVSFNGNPQRGISVNTDPIASGGTLLATVGMEGDPAFGGMIIGEWPAGASMTTSPPDILGGPRLVFLSGSRERDGVTPQAAGIYDFTPAGAQMFLNAVDYMVGREQPTYTAAVLAENPIVYYRFSDIDSNAVNSGALGIAGDGGYRNGATNGTEAPRPPQFAGFESNNIALQLDGVDDFVRGSSGLLNGLSNVTLSGWIRRAGTQRNRTGLLGQDNVIEFGYINNTTLQAWVDNFNTPVNVNSPFPNLEWSHIALVVDGSSLRMSVHTNGQLAGSAALPSGSYSNSTNFFVVGGDVFGTGGVSFGGQMDEASVFDKALTAEQIAAQYYSALISPPVIKVPPRATNIFEGQTLRLSVQAGGTRRLRYWWLYGGSVLPGEMAPTLEINSARVEQSGAYSVIVGNNYGRVESASVAVNVIPTQPPTIMQQPSSVTRYRGRSATFTVMATGAASTSYQWQLFDADLPGETNSTLTIDDISPTDEGVYRVIVSNSAGSTASADVTLTLAQPAPYSYEAAVVAAGPVAYWRLGETNGTTAFDFWGGFDGMYSNVTRGVLSPLVGDSDGAADFNGFSSAVTTPLSLNSTPVFTVIGWFNRSADQAGRAGLWGQNDLAEFGYVTNYTLQAWTGGPLDLGPDPFANGEWVQMAVVSDGSPGIITMYTNGVAATSRSHILPANNQFKFNIGGNGVFDPSGNFFNGKIDEVAVFDRALPSNEIANLYFTAGHSPPAVYEWAFDDGTLAPAVGNGIMEYASQSTTALTSFGISDGSTVPNISDQSATYMRVPAFTDFRDGYHLTFSDSSPNGGGVYMNRFTFIVDVFIPAPLNWTPFFNTNPTNANDADWYVEANGALGIAELGYAPNATVSGSNWHRLVFAADLAAGVVNYYRDGMEVFQRSGGSLLDGRFSLFSNADAGPDLLLFNEGDLSGDYTHELFVSSVAFVDRTLSAFEVAALGGPRADGILQGANRLPVVLCRNVTNVVCSDDEAHVTAFDVDNGSYDPDGIIVSLELTPAGPYSVGTTSVTLTVIDNQGGSNSCTANVIIIEEQPPVVTMSPRRTNVVAGSAVTLCASVSGSGMYELPQYQLQWHHDGVEIAGATSTCFQIANVQPSDVGEYNLLVRNETCAVWSDSVKLALIPQPDDVRQGLVAYWPLDGVGEDSVTAPDQTVFSNHLNLVNVDSSNFVQGVHGNAVALNGIDEILSRTFDGSRATGLPIYGARRYAIAMWVNGLGSSQTDRRVFAEGSANSNTPLFGFATDSATNPPANVMDVFIRTDSSATPVSHRKSTGTPFDGSWHHVAWVEEDGMVRLYIDGQLDATVFSYVPGALTLNTVAIGGIQRATVGSFFAGMIDDATIWERPLSQVEVQQVMTNSVALPIPQFPPFIVSHPSDQEVFAGERVSFRVQASGGSVSYVWLKDGTAIPDATNAVFMIENPQATDSGDYSVLVSNSEGTTASLEATLVVHPIVAITTGLIAYWPLDELDSRTPDLTSNDNDLLPVNMGPENIVRGRIGNALLFDGVEEMLGREHTNGFGLPIYQYSNYTVALWVKGNGFGQRDRRVFSESSNTSFAPLLTLGTDFAGQSSAADIFIRGGNNVVSINHLRTTNAAFDGTWHHLAWVDNDGQGRLYIDGALAVATNYVRGSLDLNTLTLGGIRRQTNSHWFAGCIDEAAVWRRPLMPSEIVSAMNQRIISNQPPVALCRNVTRIVCTGCQVSVTPTEVDNGSFDPDGIIVSRTLIPSGPYPAGTNVVNLVVTDNRGDSNSCAANIIVLEQFPPVVTVSPTQAIVAVEGSVTFCAEVAGIGPFQYQWRHNGVNIADETNQCLQINNVQLADGGAYTVIVANDAGAVLSDPAQLLLALPPVQGTDSVTNRTMVEGDTGLLSGTNTVASSDPDEPQHFGKPGGKSVWYEWSTLETGIATFTTRGSTFDTLLAVYVECEGSNLVEVASDDDSGENLTSRVQFNAIERTRYLIAVDGLAGADGQFALSWEFKPVALLLPVIISHPQSLTVAPGESATFSVEAKAGCSDCTPCANGTTNTAVLLEYQWYRNTNAIPGATNASFAIVAVDESALGSYTVEVSQSGQRIRSRAASLQLNLRPQDEEPVRAYNKLADAEFNRGIELGAPPQAPQLPEAGRPHAPQAAAGPIVRGYTGTHVFSTADGATEPSDAPVCDVIGGASYWVSFIPEQDGVLHLNTDGSDYNTVLAVFVRRANGNLRLMVCDNNGGTDPGTSALSVPVEAGRTNLVMIDGVRGETGNLHLNYSLVVPSSLTFLGMTPEGYARLRVTGRPELSLVLQVSDDMANWTPLTTNSSLTGSLDYTDTTTPPRSQRLYRALMLP